MAYYLQPSRESTRSIHHEAI